MSRPIDVGSRTEAAIPTDDAPAAAAISRMDLRYRDLESLLDFLVLHRIKIPRIVLARLLSIAPNSAATQSVLAAARTIAASQRLTGPRVVKLPRTFSIHLLGLALSDDWAPLTLTPSSPVAPGAAGPTPRTP